MPKEKFGEKVFKIEWFSMGLLRRRTCKFYQVSQQNVFKVSFIRVLSCAFGFQKAFLQTNVWITLLWFNGLWVKVIYELIVYIKNEFSNLHMNISCM